MIIKIRCLICLSCFIVSGFSSCKKDPESAAIGTISVSINGTNTTFDFGAKASQIPVTGGYGIKIQGNKKDPSQSATSLTLTIVRPTPITAGTYIENGAGNPLVSMDYFFDLLFGSGSTASAFRSPTNPVTITLTEYNSTSIKGTFSGELQSNYAGTVTKTLLSNGSFYVSF